VALSASGRWLAGNGPRNELKVWDLHRGAVGPTYSIRYGEYAGLAFSPDSTRVLLGETFRGRRPDGARATLVTHRQTAGGHEEHEVRMPLDIHSFALSADGAQVVLGGWFGEICVCDTETGAVRARWMGHQDKVLHVVFLRDGKRVVVASAGIDGMIRLWDAATGRPEELPGGEALPWKVRHGTPFSPDGRYAVACRPDICLVDLIEKTTRPLGVKADRVTCAAPERGGRRVLVGRYHDNGKPGAVDLIDVETGRKLPTINATTGEVWTMTFFPDGSRFATGGQDRHVRIWDAASGQLLLTLEGTFHAHSDIQVSPDGRTLATAISVGKVQLWEAPDAPAAP
jgi:WD40 repeat protein